MITEDWTFTYSYVNADYFLFSWLMNHDPFQTFLFTLPTTVSTGNCFLLFYFKADTAQKHHPRWEAAMILGMALLPLTRRPGSPAPHLKACSLRNP